MNFKDKRVTFFYANAGYGYNPKTETKTQGRINCAKLLANAELKAHEEELVFEWFQDEEFQENGNPTFFCVCKDSEGSVLSSLGCIEFSGDSPENPYKRVVEAELALEAIS